MTFDRSAYENLERRFRAQVDRDKAHAIERVVQGWGVYLPRMEPTSQVDYILVGGMEPSFNWARNVEEGEERVGNGTAQNYGELPTQRKDPLTLLILAMKRYLCRPGETYHMTDVSKGAMPGTVAALDADRRYGEWYPLLLEEIAIVGKPGGPVIAIGGKVRKFLHRRGFRGGGRPTSLLRTALFAPGVQALEGGGGAGPRWLCEVQARGVYRGQGLACRSIP